jgi:hypothetical protein
MTVVGRCSAADCADPAAFFTLGSRRLLCPRHAAAFGRADLGLYYRVRDGMVLPQGPDEDDVNDGDEGGEEDGDTLVPNDVLRQVGQALHEFHTSTSFDPIECSESLARLEEAWDKLRPYVPPETLQTPLG